MYPVLCWNDRLAAPDTGQLLDEITAVSSRSVSPLSCVRSTTSQRTYEWSVCFCKSVSRVSKTLAALQAARAARPQTLAPCKRAPHPPVHCYTTPSTPYVTVCEPLEGISHFAVKRLRACEVGAVHYRTCACRNRVTRAGAERSFPFGPRPPLQTHDFIRGVLHRSSSLMPWRWTLP